MKILRPALILFLVLSLITGLLYPLVTTGLAQVMFPAQANGSPLAERGSRLLGQTFTQPEYFWGRPSATTPAYNAASSSGSNLGPSSVKLKQSVVDLVAQLRKANPTQTGPVPLDLVTASGSGLDPHITPAAAYYQVDRVASARGLAPDAVRQLVARHVEGPQWGFLGDRRVNVLELNVDLDSLKK